jgi:MYXO-CTERM domain-containing protein
VVLVAQSSGERITTAVVYSVDCVKHPYDCGAQYATDSPLAPNTVWDVLVDDMLTTAFTTGDEDAWLDIPSAPDVSRGAIYDSRQADYPGYSATWQVTALLPGEWLEYEVRGDEVTAQSGATPIAAVVLGSPMCTYIAQDDGVLLNAEVRARRITPGGLAGEWSAWTDVNPAATIVEEPYQPDLDEEPDSDTSDADSAGCQSVTVSPSLGLLLMGLLGVRRRR